MKKYPRLDLPMQLVVLTILFYLGLPNMLAMFPQNMEISRERLEPRFQSYDPEERLYFNKGL
ncbi:MAG: sideroflexin, partial [archaeon]|nr:sideroflexin [archaeon]